MTNNKEMILSNHHTYTYIKEKRLKPMNQQNCRCNEFYKTWQLK